MRSNDTTTLGGGECPREAVIQGRKGFSGRRSGLSCKWAYFSCKVPKKVMDFDTWRKLNIGIEASGSDVPEHIQQRIHHIICQSFVPELAVSTADDAGRQRDQKRRISFRADI
eukprot:3625362-Amphidinium_carterae.1